MSFSTALSGLNAATADLNVKSNNIANVNTTGFKASRAEFGDVFAVSAFGTSSKTAIGSGVVLSNVAQQFNQGNLEFTDNSLDLAISGEGFFAMAPTQDSGEITYTRAGAFGINKDGFVVNSEGSFLRTFPVDANGNISATSMSAAKPLQLPASQGAPEPTTELKIATNLPSNALPLSTAATNFVAGKLTTTAPLTVFDFTADQVSFQVDGNAVTLNGNYATASGVASAIDAALPAGYVVTVDASNKMIITGPAATVPVVSAYNGNVDGDVVVADFVTGGTQTPGGAGDISSYVFGAALPTANYSVDNVSFDISFDTGAGTATNTVTLNANYATNAGVATEIANQLNTAFGAGTFSVAVDGAGIVTINTVANTANPIGAANYSNPTGTVTSVANFMVGSGTLGTAAVASAALAIDPFNPNTYNNSTSATVYDSLGNEHIVTTYYQKVDAAVATPAGTDNQWRMQVYISANDIKQPSTPAPVGIAPNQLVQLGGATVIQFTNNGTLDTVTPNNPVALAMVSPSTALSSGAANLTVALNLNGSTQNSGSFAVGALTVNGFPTGRLTGVDVSDDGLIRATYSNGQAVPIGKIALANFANAQALNKIGNTQWKETTDSGPVIAGEAATGSFGQIQSGALETSNVDLTKELVGLITAQRNFQANSKAIETNNTITQTIINIR